ncbi:apolipoprotein D-like [Coccinella septempunctata]|uniref:apolipoprotein D-like n=1 Tax=Coccinella septempunctata TaxID=41139 RepID=UPI001D073BD7|nr:apolipoprotein D-like [Coccinella septempunctata]
MFELLIVTALCFFGAHSQVLNTGKCPKIESVQQDFDLNKYLGKWYEQEKYFTIFELDGRCISATYSLADDGTVKVLNQQIDKLTNKTRSIEGSAKPQGDGKEAKLSVNFGNFGNLPIHIDAPYWILETDYVSYAVVWSCTDFGILSTKFAWILTRERNPPSEVLEKSHAVFDKFNLNKKSLQKTDQENCPEDI